VLLSTVALWLFARALRTGERRDVLLWAVASALALLSHYFAAFTIAPEAVWLLLVWRRERRDLRPLLLGFAGVAAVAAALLPLALDQRAGDRQAFIHELPRGTRIEDFVRHPLAGELGGPVHGFVQAGAVLALVAVALLVLRGSARERRGAVIAFGIAAGSVVVPFVGSFTDDYDYLFARNSLAIVVPLLIVLAAGLAAGRAGWIGAATLVALCALWMTVNVSVPLDDSLQRDDWRGAVRALGPPSEPRVVATAPEFLDVPLAAYLEGESELGPRGTAVRELDVVRLRRGSQAATAPIAIKGFTPVAVKRTVSYELDRYRAPAPVHVTPATLAPIKPTSTAFVQR
jgi:hypothetical protein